MEGIARGRRTNGEEEDSGDDESKESDDEEHHEIERGDALLDVEIIAGEERGRDVKIATKAIATKTRKLKTGDAERVRESDLACETEEKNNNRIRMPPHAWKRAVNELFYSLRASSAYAENVRVLAGPGFRRPASRRSLIARQLVEGMDYVHEKDCACTEELV